MKRNSKINESTIAIIKSLIEAGVPQTKIGKTLGVSHGTVGAVKKNNYDLEAYKAYLVEQQRKVVERKKASEPQAETTEPQAFVRQEPEESEEVRILRDIEGHLARIEEKTEKTSIAISNLLQIKRNQIENRQRSGWGRRSF